MCENMDNTTLAQLKNTTIKETDPKLIKIVNFQVVGQIIHQNLAKNSRIMIIESALTYSYIS